MFALRWNFLMSRSQITSKEESVSIAVTNSLPEEVINTEPSHSAFSVRQKKWIVFIAAFAAWFSTASSFLFFPAIDALAKGLHTSVQNINLTVTSYLLVAGVAPALTASVADKAGRRPAFMLSFAIFLGANIGLALQRNFASLFVLRMMQAVGVAGTFAIAYGVLADITTPAERGSYVGVVAFCTNTAPSIGPVIASSLNTALGWRSIFWFLVVCSGLWLLLIALTLPETVRSIVGNGMIRPHRAWHRVPLHLMLPRGAMPSGTRDMDDSARSQAEDGQHLSAPRSFLAILLQKDKALVMSAIAILYMVWNCLQASLSTLFIKIYHFTYFQAGLIYIPFGLGVACAGFFTGRLLDRDYRIVAKQYRLPASRSNDYDLSKFPVEKARFRSTSLPLAVVCASLIAYGWCIRYRVHVSIPLVLQLLLGASLQVCFTTLNTLLMDLDPLQASTTQAVSNLYRCLFAAGAVAILETVINNIGEGCTFTIVAGCAAVCFLIFELERRCGWDWRLARMRCEAGTDSQ